MSHFQQPPLSFWEAETLVGHPQNIVLGSGIVGLSAAIALKKRYPNERVLVLERGILPTGASTRNAGFACFGSISELLDDLSKGISESALMDLVEMRWQGLARLRENLGDEGIGYEPSGGMEIFTNPEDFERCVAAIPHFNQLMESRLGLKQVYTLLSQQETADLGFAGICGVIRNNAEGAIHTGRMMQSLLRKAQLSGVEILNGIDVQTIHTLTDGACVETSAGWTISTKRLLICTNGFAKRVLPQLEVQPARNQVLITEPLGRKLPWQGCFHYEEGYYYFRNVGEDRVLLGGGRHLDRENEMTDDFGNTNLIQQALIQLLNNVILPNWNPQIGRWWSGILGIGDIKRPIVQLVGPNIGVAVRMGGMGVAIGSLVGEQGAALWAED